MLITHEDSLSSFIPDGEVQFIILGTMVAINARTIDGIRPSEEFFYYNNSRNHFWRILQHLMNPKLKTKEDLEKFDIAAKKNFLNTHGIAICNLVNKVMVPPEFKHDPSDTVLFAAQKENLIEFKKVSPKVKKLIQTKPMFFTSRKKKGIDLLLDGFFETNKISPTTKEHIWYWPTPTRCNPYNRSLIWREEMLAHYKSIS